MLSVVFALHSPKTGFRYCRVIYLKDNIHKSHSRYKWPFFTCADNDCWCSTHLPQTGSILWDSCWGFVWPSLSSPQWTGHVCRSGKPQISCPLAQTGLEPPKRWKEYLTVECFQKLTCQCKVVTMSSIETGRAKELSERKHKTEGTEKEERRRTLNSATVNCMDLPCYLANKPY